MNRRALLVVLLLSVPCLVARADDEPFDIESVFPDAYTHEHGETDLVLDEAGARLWSDFLSAAGREAAVDYAARCSRVRLSLTATAVEIPRRTPALDALIDGEAALLTADDEGALRGAIADGSARVARRAAAAGGYGTRLTAQDWTLAPPGVYREVESHIGIAASWPRTTTPDHGLRLEARLAPHAAGGVDVRYGVVWSDVPTLLPSETPAGPVVGFELPVRLGAGHIRIVPGETAILRFVERDGPARLVLLRLTTDSVAAPPVLDLGGGFVAAATSHLLSDGVTPLPDVLDELFESRDEPDDRTSWTDDRRRFADAAQDVAGIADIDCVQGPFGLSIFDLGLADPRVLIDALLRGAAVRGSAASVQISDAERRVVVPTCPGGPFRAYDLVLALLPGQYSVETGCNSCLLLERGMEPRAEGLAATGRACVDGTVELDAARVSVTERTDAPWLGWRMLAGYGATAELPLETVEETRTAFGVRHAVASGDGDLGGVLRARVSFAAASGLPSPQVVHDASGDRGGSLPIGGRGHLTETAEVLDAVQVSLAGRRFAVRPDAPVEIVDLTTRRTLAGAAADGSCGMVARYPETIDVESGLRARLRVTHDDDDGWTADVDATLHSAEPPSPPAGVVHRRRLSLATRSMPVGPRQTVAWSPDAAIGLELPGLPPLSRPRRRVEVRTDDGAHGFVAAPGAEAWFESGGTRVVPTYLYLYTSNHASADVSGRLSPVRDGVVVLLRGGRQGGLARLHLALRGAPTLRDAPASYRVHPVRAVAPEPLVRVTRQLLRHDATIGPDGRLDLRSDDDAPLAFDLSVAPLAPGEEER